jgi:hypothetical protein
MIRCSIVAPPLRWRHRPNNCVRDALSAQRQTLAGRNTIELSPDGAYASFSGENVLLERDADGGAVGHDLVVGLNAVAVGANNGCWHGGFSSQYDQGGR